MSERAEAGDEARTKNLRAGPRPSRTMRPTREVGAGESSPSPMTPAPFAAGGCVMEEANRPRCELPRMRDNLPALRELAEALPPGGLLVEIGSFAGESTRVFLEVGLRVHAIDPWDNAARDRLHEGAWNFDPNHRWPFDMETVEQTFDDLAETFADRLTKRKGYDWVFVNEYDDESVDAIYIDSVHTYADTLATILRWKPKVRPGGFLCGHDFSWAFPGVCQAVRESLGEPVQTFADTSWICRAFPVDAKKRAEA